MLIPLTRRERNRQQAEQIIARISLHLEIETLIRNKAMHCIPEEISSIVNFDLYTPPQDFPEVQEYIPDIPEFDFAGFQWNPVQKVDFAPQQGKSFSLQCVVEATRAGVPYEQVLTNG